MNILPDPATLLEAEEGALMTAVAQDRSAQALEEIYRRYHPLLRGVISRVVNDHAEVDEVLQDVFIQVWGIAGFYSADKGHLVSWLVTIARRRALDRVRRLCAYRNLTDRYEKALAPPRPCASEMFTVDRQVCHNEVRHQITLQLNKLPDAQREAVNLTFFQGLTQREIAARLAVPLGTIKTRIELGMQKMGQFLHYGWAAA